MPIKHRSAPALFHHRRRGSVLVLVMTVLGILFVLGVAFMATTNFESELVSIERQRTRRAVGLESVVDQVNAVMRNGVFSTSQSPFGGALGAPFVTEPAKRVLGASPIAIGELSGVHNFFAPVEPRRVVNPADPSDVRFVFDSSTDLLSLTESPETGSQFRSLPIDGLDASWISGVELVLDPDTTPPILITPVDSDGDGVTDTLQFPVDRLGISASQIDAMAPLLNSESNPNGRVYLGMRVMPHGGLVNLNESHQNMIAWVMGLQNRDGVFDPKTLLSFDSATPNRQPGLFEHGPLAERRFYSPAMEESLLRRRVLLPPRDIPPSLLHGNLLAARNSRFPAGAAHLPAILFPPDSNGSFNFKFQTVFDGRHRYAPFSLDRTSSRYQFVQPSADVKIPLWAVRMEPLSARAFVSTRRDPWMLEYDRRHLLTTISYSDNLARGGRAVDKMQFNGSLGKQEPASDADLRSLMIAANKAERKVFGADRCPKVLPFEYANYPHTIDNDCPLDCPGDEGCVFDVRKGRLKLSLAWLDEAFDCKTVNNLVERDLCERKRMRLIHDVFIMLVRNAHGAYWDIDVACDTQACSDPNVGCPLCPEFGTCGEDGLCHDPVTDQRRRDALISRTAASLTANMIDFMDSDDKPTRVAIRSLDFLTKNRDGDPTKAGRPLVLDQAPNDIQYVYGLERQPFITEVATSATTTAQTGGVEGFAVELFNPYGDDLGGAGGDGDGDGLIDYWLVPVADGKALPVNAQNPALIDTAKAIPITDVLRRGDFSVFVRGVEFFPRLVDKPNDLVFPVTDTVFEFLEGATVYLIRRVNYDGERTDIVVDQFNVNGPNIGRSGGRIVDLPQSTPPPMPPFVVSMHRSADADTAPWDAPVPVLVPSDQELVLDHSLGQSNPDLVSILPVEVNFANTGSFTQKDPRDQRALTPQFGRAFPTTGSMLLLMRVGNRSVDDFEQVRADGSPWRTEDLAFTTWLDDATSVTVDVESSPPQDPPLCRAAIRSVDEASLIGNGRMPVFDDGVEVPVGADKVRFYAHHVHTTTDPTMPKVPDASDRTLSTCQLTENRPGRLMHLPWGQLVFDYFTALPLSSLGPYGDTSPDAVGRLKQDAQPRVDQDGLRVHGRININAAPWFSMAGLPMMTMENMPLRFRDKIRQGAGLRVVNDDESAMLGEGMAQAIVAYRDLREISGTNASGIPFSTGDFGKNGTGRGWNVKSPAMRRGTGFLSVGELANVRHAEATSGTFRIDGGETADYVLAVAKLVALGDWVTPRSHVFTLYGTLRGEGDEEITDLRLRASDVDDRAIRFQETVDRLPMFLGEPSPQRIGERTVARYADVIND